MDEKKHPWIDGVAVAITVTRADGTIVAMNPRSIETFSADGGASLIGRSVFDCHPEPARTKTLELYETQRANSYTVRKGGQKKVIHQLPWFEGGEFAGFVEISIPIPDELPHFERD